MKTLQQPKKVPRYLNGIADTAIELAYGFICARYKISPADIKCHIIYSPARRGIFFANNKRPHKVYGNEPCLVFNSRSQLYFYDRVSTGGKLRAINGGYVLGSTTCLIHELTHYVQYLQGRKYSEVETTQNELDFIAQYDPEIRALITQVN